MAAKKQDNDTRTNAQSSGLESRHTPGPWEMSKDATPDWHVQITVYAEADGQRVATAFRTEANARLIAAAPEMFEALKACITEQGATAERSHDYAMRRLAAINDLALSAIAKAEGSA